MPDNDYVPRGVHGKWRTVYRALLDGEVPAVIGSLLEKAHAAEMRQRPCPGIDELARALHNSALFNDSSGLQQALHDFYLEAGRTPIAKRYCEEAEALFAVERLAVAAMPESRVLERLGQCTLERLADASVFAAARPELLQRRFQSFGAEQRYEQGCQEAVNYPTLIGRQVARPDGVGITAPGRPRRSQTDILEDDIL